MQFADASTAAQRDTRAEGIACCREAEERSCRSRRPGRSADPACRGGVAREVLVAALAVVVTANHFVIDVAGGIVS